MWAAWLPREKVFRVQVERLRELADGARVGLDLVTLDAHYRRDADPGPLRELLLREQRAFPKVPELVADVQHPAGDCSCPLRVTALFTKKLP